MGMVKTHVIASDPPEPFRSLANLVEFIAEMDGLDDVTIRYVDGQASMQYEDAYGRKHFYCVIDGQWCAAVKVMQ